MIRLLAAFTTTHSFFSLSTEFTTPQSVDSCVARSARRSYITNTLPAASRAMQFANSTKPSKPSTKNPRERSKHGKTSRSKHPSPRQKKHSVKNGRYSIRLGNVSRGLKPVSNSKASKRQACQAFFRPRLPYSNY